MSVDLDRLKELFQGYVASKRPLSRQGCPDPADLVSSFEPAASRRRKKRIIEHISQCPLCREEFMVLVERQSGEPDLAEASARSGPREHSAPADEGLRRPLRPFWRFATALLGLILMVSSLVVVVRQRDRWNALRSGETAILLLAPKTDQAVAGPPLYRWQARTPAEYFVLEIYDEALLPVWTSDRVRASELRLPSGVYARLQPGRRYFWMVTGYSGQATSGESPMGRFIVSR